MSTLATLMALAFCVVCFVGRDTLPDRRKMFCNYFLVFIALAALSVVPLPTPSQPTQVVRSQRPTADTTSVMTLYATPVLARK